MAKHIIVLSCSLLLICLQLSAQTIIGTVKNRDGASLPYASIEVKGSHAGTTANADGKFSLSLAKGQHTITCQHVGYEKVAITIDVQQESNTVDFVLKPITLTLQEVIVKKGEDPAYAIIRNAIKVREKYRKEFTSFTTEVYTKGQLRLRNFPTKFMGQKVDFEDGDTSKNKFLFLSESIAKYAVAPPDKSKIEVIATKVSGESNAYGLSAPRIISFYNSNVTIGDRLNAHGFISPIADNALHFYNYKYEGAFFEEGRQISRIKVMPKRRFEPLFSGYINIVEDEWRIHSLQLQLTKESRMEFIDTLRLEQLYVAFNANQWALKSQVIYPTIKLLGFDAHGSFANIYSSYNFNPTFPKGYFDNILLKYADSAIKKTEDYWATARPIVLQEDEVADYRKKDSLEQVRKSPAYMDSLDRIRNKITLEKLLTGIRFDDEKSRSSISTSTLLDKVSYNTVEGFVGNIDITYQKQLDTLPDSRKNIMITPAIRYGFSNQHFNANLTTRYTFGRRYKNALTIAGGKDVFQFDNSGPAHVLGSTFATLARGKNYMKIYEAWFGNLQFSKGLGKGLIMQLVANYQDRMPLENTTRFTFHKEEGLTFTPNTPYPVTDTNIRRHQAFIIVAGLSWQPGTRYIQYANRMVSLGSKLPVFGWYYTQAFDHILGSDVSYSKWLMRVTDQVNLKLVGNFNYRVDIGGFIQKKRVEVPDLIHFRGNMSNVLSGDYLERFQLVPHYYFSHSEPFYSAVFAEHHFNGFITNKIPGLKHWKWNLVTGVSGLYLKSGRYYVEPSVGIENIFKIIRLDYFWGFEKGGVKREDFRIGIKTPLGINR